MWVAAVRYSLRNLATSSAAETTAVTAPMPCPEPQMTRQGFALLPSLGSPKFRVEGSETGRLSGSRPERMTDGRK
jgi:hypothetical protein